MTPILTVDALEVRYGSVPALHGIGLHVAPGEAVALLGANGAGKSTLMKTVIGLLNPSAGRILFDGRPLGAMRTDRRARLGIGFCPEGRRTFPGLTVRENLCVACWGTAHVRAQRLDATFALFPALATRQSTPAWQLSGGQQQMLAIGRSLMDAPRLLLLDEPSLGLSPRLTDEVLGRIPRHRRRGHCGAVGGTKRRQGPAPLQPGGGAEAGPGHGGRAGCRAGRQRHGARGLSRRLISVRYGNPAA